MYRYYLINMIQEITPNSIFGVTKKCFRRMNLDSLYDLSAKIGVIENVITDLSLLPY
jgi:hypothetical protein